MRIVEDDEVIDRSFIYLNARSLPTNKDPYICDRESTSLDAFRLPQMIVKLTWTFDDARFKATIVHSDPETGPVFCERSYFSVHALEGDQRLLEAAWLGLNSSLAVYFLLLTSGRFASWVPEPNKSEFMAVPLPDPQGELLAGLTRSEDVDARMLKSVRLQDAEKALIEDLYCYTLPDYKGGKDSPGRLATARNGSSPSGSSPEPLLSQYCHYFVRVLKAGFGSDKPVGATVFSDSSVSPLPVRLVAIHLDAPKDYGIRVEGINSAALLDLLERLDEILLRRGRNGRGIFSQAVARVYDSYEFDGSRRPTVYIVKPDRVRFWTRSAALRDADEVSGDLSEWLGVRAFI